MTCLANSFSGFATQNDSEEKFCSPLLNHHLHFWQCHKGNAHIGTTSELERRKAVKYLLKRKTNIQVTEDIDHAACMINGSFANDTNGSQVAGKRMGNICKEVHQLCMCRRKSSCISNCPIRKCSKKSRFIASIFQALTVHFYSNFQLEHLIGPHPFFPTLNAMQ